MNAEEIIKEYYEFVAAIREEDSIARVWKPKTMKELPEDVFKRYVPDVASNASIDCHGKRFWAGNPDYGKWDAMVLKRYKTGHEVDIYFCAILVRPFSKAAYEYYSMLSSKLYKTPADRLGLMWDNRVFDNQP